MELIKLGKKGQVSIPQGVLRDLGLVPETPLLVETTSDGAILLRQVSIHPVEIYSQQRLDEFAREDALSPDELASSRALLDRFNRQIGRRTENLPAPDAQPSTDRAATPVASTKSGAGRRR